MNYSKQNFTTGDLATICGVSRQTATKWIERGMIKAFRVPGGKDRRIPRAELIRFLKANEVPLGGLEESQS